MCSVSIVESSARDAVVEPVARFAKAVPALAKRAIESNMPCGGSAEGGIERRPAECPRWMATERFEGQLDNCVDSMRLDTSLSVLGHAHSMATPSPPERHPCAACTIVVRSRHDGRCVGRMHG